MRTLATTVVSQVLLATVTLTGAWASAGPDKTSKKTVNRVMFDAPDVRATVHGSQASIRSKAELNLATDDVETRLFRNTGVINDFSGSALRFGRAVRSPYLARLGVGDGFSARFRSSSYTVAGTVLSGHTANSIAAELAAFDGALAFQAGHKETALSVGSTSFAGAHVDFEVLNAEVSLRWHMGRERAEGGTNESSAGGIAVAVPSVLEDGDRLRAAMSRPVRPGFGFETPDFNVAYMMPMPVGRLTCSGGIESKATRVSAVRMSWAMTW
ncbi:hypothetical protein BAL199_17838 [alpha proteobacterium BAL199]|nr:hypothetical protein BAL199_17838 [alpha proteobacterium BAL199]